ncbi:phosphoserine phosphatase SerB [Marinomonas sp. 15G1-11]|uniref:Phosphoserine phosphatase n=1 Tax=Marinomonas phaeophyticola TaxID=3004091 RepID=A0ABT4JU39_9GAMM|nr:phosphoserine phosphatase SerB [Marinomonas sp. 15G1-11]MCZ2721736.1 phosphoserine phosphatase SerB [Marinomonas sp. 15G1-11]
MSASITLIGSITLPYLEGFEAWIKKGNLFVNKQTLTDDSDSYDVVRYNLTQPFPESKLTDIQEYLLSLSDSTNIDHVYQSKSIDITKPGVAVFDMDSTLIKAEVMDELAVDFGIGEKISKVTASAMRGEIDFIESFVQRLALLEGLSSDVMDGVYKRIIHMDGIAVLMKVLNHFHWHTAILSGGFTYFADRIAKEYGISEVHANVLEIENGKLTGKHLGPIVDASRKRQLLEDIVSKNELPWDQTIACGDGANDLLMLNSATLGVALHAKPLVRKDAPHPMSALGLDGILYLLGMTTSDIRAITNL